MSVRTYPVDNYSVKIFKPPVENRFVKLQESLKNHKKSRFSKTPTTKFDKTKPSASPPAKHPLQDYFDAVDRRFEDYL